MIRKRNIKILEPNRKTIDILQLEKELSEITEGKVIINFDDLKKVGNINWNVKSCQNLIIL